MSITINAYQLRQAAEFAAPDYETDADQRETEMCLEQMPAGTFNDGEPRPAGLYLWYADYPEEGCILLEPEIGKATPDTYTQAELDEAAKQGKEIAASLRLE